ncbi:hypothetical protein [Campylobacter lanienae]|uniref:hypothetical protein n=1 Tax=Campylobacter lanienae TaxID=75658 RepID=UPI000BB440A8|nr:hypothetical protein [Campylobacter lanienae]
MAQLIILLIALWVLWGILYMIFRVVSIIIDGILYLAGQYSLPIYDKTTNEKNRFKEFDAKFGI